MAQPIKATLNVTLAPWTAPNFARCTSEDPPPSGPTREEGSIPVRELSDEALEALAYAWLVELYAKARPNSRRIPWDDPALRPKAGDPR